jgi:delta24-sterol reductase
LGRVKHITMGGAIMGAALESSSHMHGNLLDGCRRVELLLGDGSVAWGSRTERTDLFDALSGSYGTLGLLLSAESECQPASLLLEIKYPSVDEGVAALQVLFGPVGCGSGSSRTPFL